MSSHGSADDVFSVETETVLDVELLESKPSTSDYEEAESCIIRNQGLAALKSFFTSGHCRPLEFFSSFRQETSADWLESIPLPLVYAQVLNKHLGLKASKKILPSDSDEVFVLLEMRCQHEGNTCPNWQSYGSGSDLRSALDVAAVGWIRTLFYMTRDRPNQMPVSTEDKMKEGYRKFPTVSASLSNLPSVHDSKLSPHSPEFYPSSFVRASESDPTLMYTHASNLSLTEESTSVSSYSFHRKTREASVSGEDTENLETPEDRLTRILLVYSPEIVEIPPLPNLAFLPSDPFLIGEETLVEIPPLERIEDFRMTPEEELQESESLDIYESWHSVTPAPIPAMNQEEKSFGTRYWSNRRRRRRNHQDPNRPSTNYGYPHVVQSQNSFETFWVPQPIQYPVYQVPYIVYPPANFQTIESSTVQTE